MMPQSNKSHAEDSRAERERTFFDSAPEYKRRRLDKYYSLAARSTALYRDLIPVSGQHILEIGCGDGSSALSLAQAGATVVAIDISDRRIEAAQGLATLAPGRVSFLIMDAEHLGFHDDTFDVVCGQAILHHLGLRRSLVEVARTLKADGSAFFIEPLGHNPFINLYRRLTPTLRTPDEAPLTAGDLTLMHEFFAEARFTFFHLTSFVAIPLRRLPFGRNVTSSLESLDQVLFRVFPRLQRYAWRVVIELRRPRKGEGALQRSL